MRTLNGWLKCFAMAALFLAAGAAQAAVIRAGFNATDFGPSDDGVTGTLPLGFTVNFFGNSRSAIQIDNNGAITLDGSGGLGFTPENFPVGSSGRDRVQVYHTDILTNSTPTMHYGSGTVDGHNAFGATWVNVGCFSGGGSNSFQGIIIDRSDTGAGNFDVELNYDTITANCGHSPRAAVTNGTGVVGTFFELPGSGTAGAFFDSNPTTGLINHSSASCRPLGRYVIPVRSGVVVADSCVPPSNCDSFISANPGVNIIVGTDGNDNLVGSASVKNAIIGLGGNDTLTAGPLGDCIDGGEGNDHLIGGGGDDKLFGAGGTDWLEGKGGNDTLNGGAGADRLDGGAASDTCNDSASGNQFISCEVIGP